MPKITTPAIVPFDCHRAWPELQASLYRRDPQLVCLTATKSAHRVNPELTYADLVTRLGTLGWSPSDSGSNVYTKVNAKGQHLWPLKIISMPHITLMGACIIDLPVPEGVGAKVVEIPSFSDNCGYPRRKLEDMNSYVVRSTSVADFTEKLLAKGYVPTWADGTFTLELNNVGELQDQPDRIAQKGLVVEISRVRDSYMHEDAIVFHAHCTWPRSWPIPSLK